MKLEEWEEICSDCNGLGTVEIPEGDGYPFSFCCKCKGTGKLDWLEKITDKKNLVGFIPFIVINEWKKK